MNYPEKVEEIPKHDWLEKLQGLHITRADMNRLIMNYLVTGKSFFSHQVSLTRQPYLLTFLNTARDKKGRK